MPIKIIYGTGTKITESCIWLIPTGGKREICLTYEYFPATGELKYAASIFRKDPERVVTDAEIANHVHTTTRRFEMRPVEIVVGQFLNYDQLIDCIRHEMCHGWGCRGTRNEMAGGSQRNVDTPSSDSSDSSYDSSSSVGGADVGKGGYQVADRIHGLKTTHRFLYRGEREGEDREIFVAWKGSRRSGDLVFGAAIRRGSDIGNSATNEAHFKTAEARLAKRPVQMNVEPAYRHQMTRHDPRCGHREDIMYVVLDQLFHRRDGKLQISGVRPASAESATAEPSSLWKSRETTSAPVGLVEQSADHW